MPDNIFLDEENNFKLCNLEYYNYSEKYNTESNNNIYQAPEVITNLSKPKGFN